LKNPRQKTFAQTQNGASTLFFGLQRPFDILMGNSLVFALLIWSISWFYLPIDWPISRYSPRKIAT
jgi:hypothetical protein